MFTVIVPTHNRPALLQRTLQSLIAQTYTDFTVIVVDDSASYVPPYAELAQLRGRYHYLIRSGTPGPATSRNMALSLAQSRYVMFLDDDDTLQPTHLASLAAQLSATQPAMAFCDFTVQHEDRTQQPPAPLEAETISLADVTVDSVFVRNRIPNSCVVYRSDVLRDIRHDASLQLYEDWDFLLQCLHQHTLVHIPVASVVIHKSSADAPENMRRGNHSATDEIVDVMLDLYQRHPAPNAHTRTARHDLLAGAGIVVPMERC